MTIIRSQDSQNYTIIDRFVFDVGLSLGALGVYAFLATHDMLNKADLNFVLDNSGFFEDVEEVKGYYNELLNCGMIQEGVRHD